ncbi:MAG: DNA-binding protein Alba [Candidatus Micrarchaeia archaeon]
MNETPQAENEFRNEVRNKDGADNVIYVGKKSTMNYVLAVVTQFNSGANEVVIKARGKAISKAVDIKEIAVSRFLPNVKTKSIVTSSEELTNEDGTKSKVSAIHITLAK